MDSYTESREDSPQWAEFSKPELGAAQPSSMAILDVHSPACLQGEENPYGGGDIGTVYELVDKASEAGFRLIQFNPINDSGSEPCPYLAKGFFSYDPAYIAVEKIPQLEGDQTFTELVAQRKIEMKTESSDEIETELQALEIARKKNFARRYSLEHEIAPNIDFEEIPKQFKKSFCIKLSKELEEYGKNLEIAKTNKPQNRFSHTNLRRFKIDALEISYKNMGTEEARDFESFREAYDKNVFNYIVFTALSDHFEKSWHDWPQEYKNEQGDTKAIFETIASKLPDLKEKINFIFYTQYKSERQWQDLVDHAEKKNIGFAMDKAIYPQPDSADVWANQHIFYLNPDGTPKYISGCNSPGDPYGEQEWGHAVFQFAEKPAEVIDFIVENIRHMTKLVKTIRLDHVLALIWKYYIIDTGTKEGKHIPALKDRLFQRLKAEFPDVIFLAEDVGYKSEEEVAQPLRDNGLPGMRCPVWVTDSDYTEIEQYPENCAAMTGNHDMSGIFGWWYEIDDEITGCQTKIDFFKKIYGDQPLDVIIKKIWGDKVGVYGYSNDEKEKIIFDFISFMMNSRAKYVSITARDLARDGRCYNRPGSVGPENWSLLLPKLKEMHFARIGEIIRKSRRSVSALAKPQPVSENTHQCHLGESFTLCIATTHYPEKIKIDTTLPDTDNLKSSDWRAKEYSAQEFKITKYKDGTYVCEIDLPIPSGIPAREYELATTVFYKNKNEVCLQNYGENLKLAVLEKQ